MAKGLGSFGGATLERSKLDTKQEVKTQEPRVDNSGGGGNNGKNIFNGGGGDGDDGDDDDYFDEFGDGDGDGDGDDFFRTVVQQLYTKEAIDAVLQEWFRTVADLPAIIRQSVQMGLFSSAQLVRFLSMDVRPNVTRAVTRTMPPAVSIRSLLAAVTSALQYLSVSVVYGTFCSYCTLQLVATILFFTNAASFNAASFNSVAVSCSANSEHLCVPACVFCLSLLLCLRDCNAALYFTHCLSGAFGAGRVADALLVQSQVSRGVVGRLMADPAFVQKMLVEQVISISSSLAWEARQRGENFTKELDLVAINTLSVAASTGALVWLIAPNRSYGAVHKFPWQNMLQSMPNNLFDASTPYRQFSMGNRAASLVVKSAELCAVGSIAGAAMSGLSQLAVGLRHQRDPSFTPSVPIPDLAKSTAGMGMYMALSANLRYQAVSGIDRGMFDHCNVLWMYLGCSSAVRLCNNLVGEATRRWLQGIPTHSPAVLQQRSPVAPAPVPVAQAKRKKPAKPSKKKRSSSNKGFEMSAGVHPAAA